MLAGWRHTLLNTVLIVASIVILPLAYLRRRFARRALSSQEREDQTRARNRQRNMRALQHLQQWMAEDAAMIATEKEAAAAEWVQIKTDLDANRLSDRPLFP